MAKGGQFSRNLHNWSEVRFKSFLRHFNVLAIPKNKIEDKNNSKKSNSFKLKTLFTNV